MENKNHKTFEIEKLFPHLKVEKVCFPPSTKEFELDELRGLIIDSNVEVLPTVEETKHDHSTVKYYPAHVRAQCTCGYHSPPPGLVDRPKAHIKTCGFRISEMKATNEQILIT